MPMAAESPRSELPPERVAELTAGDAELIDVRREEEWEAGRIAGARHVEMNQLTASAEAIPRDRPVIFYCRSGGRSAMAADAFREAGYDAHHLAGGLTAWVESGLSIEGEVASPLPAS